MDPDSDDLEGGDGGRDFAQGVQGRVGDMVAEDAIQADSRPHLKNAHAAIVDVGLLYSIM